MKETFEKALELLGLEQQKFEQLYGVAKNAHFDGKEEEIDAYLEYMDSRQIIIDEIQKLDNEYNEIKAQLNAAKPEFAQIIASKEKINMIIKDIKDIDFINNGLFIKLKSSMSDEMMQNRKRMSVSTKYLSVGESINSVFFDKTN